MPILEIVRHIPLRRGHCDAVLKKHAAVPAGSTNKQSLWEIFLPKCFLLVQWREAALV